MLEDRQDKFEGEEFVVKSDAPETHISATTGEYINIILADVY